MKADILGNNPLKIFFAKIIPTSTLAFISYQQLRITQGRLTFSALVGSGLHFPVPLPATAVDDGRRRRGHHRRPIEEANEFQQDSY